MFGGGFTTNFHELDELHELKYLIVKLSSPQPPSEGGYGIDFTLESSARDSCGRGESSARDSCGRGEKGAWNWIYAGEKIEIKKARKKEFSCLRIEIMKN